LATARAAARATAGAAESAATWAARATTWAAESAKVAAPAAKSTGVRRSGLTLGGRIFSSGAQA